MPFSGYFSPLQAAREWLKVAALGRKMTWEFGSHSLLQTEHNLGLLTRMAHSLPELCAKPSRHGKRGRTPDPRPSHCAWERIADPWRESEGPCPPQQSKCSVCRDTELPRHVWDDRRCANTFEDKIKQERWKEGKTEGRKEGRNR